MWNPHLQYPAHSNVPKQQWALINEHRLLEQQKAAVLEQETKKKQKQLYRQELKRQMNRTKGKEIAQKQAERQYSQFIAEYAHNLEKIERQKKQSRCQKRRQIEEENQNHAEQLRKTKQFRQFHSEMSRHLDIGAETQKIIQNQTKQQKKEMIDELDQQVKLKSMEKKLQKSLELSEDEQNLKYQYDQFDRRKMGQKHLVQNPLAYQHYQQLSKQNEERERQFDKRIIEFPAERSRSLQLQRSRQKQQLKRQENIKIKEALDHQVMEHNRRIVSEKKDNWEEDSYSMFKNMFRDRELGYDKKKYSQYLKRQAQQQQQQRKKEKFMSEIEYRMNFNQLNKAVSGNYGNRHYLDRSIGSIGENKLGYYQQITEPIPDPNTQNVKKRMDELKERQPRYLNQ